MATLPFFVQEGLMSHSGKKISDKNENSNVVLDQWIIVDAHNDTMMKVVDPENYSPTVDIGQPTTFHIDLPKMRAGNVKIAYFAAYTLDHGTFEKNNNMILASINALQFTENNNKDCFCVATSYSEIEKTIQSNHRIGIQTIEGAYAFTESNMNNLLQQYSDLGVKVIAPVWNHSNTIGEGTLAQFVDGTPSSGGLTKLGREFIGAMNEKGIVIDVSHMNERTFWDAIHLSKLPLIASHSGASVIKPHVRNLTDEQLKAIAEKDGVINVVFCRYFIGDENAGVSELVDHIDHIVKTVGIRHVGLGSDFDGATMPVDLQDISQVGKIIETLESRGYQSDDIGFILGGNNLRVLKCHDKPLQTVGKMKGALTIEKKQEFYRILLPLEEEVINKSDLKNMKIKCIFDGLLKPIEWHSDTNYLEVILEKSIQEPFHVITFELNTPDGERYFCTRVVELR